MKYIELTIEELANFPLQESCLIEASAGTGKTYTIANLYLNHILNGREVSEILVVTFTNAATDELRGRIRKRLYDCYQYFKRGNNINDQFLEKIKNEIVGEEALELAVNRLKLAVRSMDEASIYTIHGFCQRALTEFSFNSGQQFQLTLTSDDEEYLLAAANDWWRRTVYPASEQEARLYLQCMGNVENLISQIKTLSGVQDKRLIPEDSGKQAIEKKISHIERLVIKLGEEWNENYKAICDSLLTSKGLSRSQKSPYKLSTLEQTLSKLSEYFSMSPSGLPIEDAEILAASTISKYRLKKKPSPELDDEFFSQCDELIHQIDELNQDAYVWMLNDALSYIKDSVKNKKQQLQVMGFDDLLTELHGALLSINENSLELAQQIVDRFPVAMIDEFQDTDAVQYAIFRQLYLNREKTGLIVIGDPKQAIYSFRGGDVFTYMQAKQDVGENFIYTLKTNWRSVPGVVSAVNHIFSRKAEDSFIFGKTIPFIPANAAEDKQHNLICRGSVSQKSLTIWQAPLNDKNKPHSKEQLSNMVHLSVAGEIAELISQGSSCKAMIGDKPIQPGDIAVLVRKSSEAQALREVLSAFGVNAVSVGKSSVFHSEEAEGLDVLLQAILSPHDRTIARVALTSSLLRHDYMEVDRISRSESDWIQWIDLLIRLHDVWLQKGFMVCFQLMLSEMKIGAGKHEDEKTERRLTNIIHLSELIQKASRSHAGMDALYQWFRQKRLDKASDETELRLESDDDLVQIVTIHASKGLQYPIVFIPYLWSCQQKSTQYLLEFHRDGEILVDAGSDELDSHLILAERERLAEDIRLAYVALTRAESKIYLVWGKAGTRQGRAETTALAYLLHSNQSGDELKQSLPLGFDKNTDITSELDTLAKDSGEIEVLPLPVPEKIQKVELGKPEDSLELKVFDRELKDNWSIKSFTAFTRDLKPTPEWVNNNEKENDVALSFPAGNRVGSYLHVLLEKLDFQRNISEQVEKLSPLIAPRFAIDHEKWGEPAAQWLERVVNTSFDENGFMLSKLDRRHRLNELEFNFSTSKVKYARLNQLLSQNAGQEMPNITGEVFAGMINGVIDLVFEDNGKYYIADYKSNYLGGQLNDYRPDKLNAAVLHRRYDLQLMLYSLALHRYLSYRIPNYQYAVHFGGVYYLFMRGMRPETGGRFGVYFTKLEVDLIRSLDEEVFSSTLENTL